MHAREVLRDAVAALVTGLTTTGARVYQSRVYPLESTELPCLLVYLGDEAIEYLTMDNPRMQERRLDIIIEGHAVANADIDEVLDDMAEQIETAIGAAPVLYNTAGVMLTSVTHDSNGSGNQPAGIVRLTYMALYCTDEANPQTIL